MTADHTGFYIEILESRLRFLTARIAKVGRLDETFDTLTAERDDVEHELEGLRDDRSAAAAATKQNRDGR